MKINIRGIDKTIKLIDSLENNTNKNVKRECKNQIENTVEEASNLARYIYMRSDYAGVNDVKVTEPKWNENEISFEAQGNSVLFIEFGTGINYEDVSYGSNYPKSKLSPTFIRGTYGRGLGSKETWTFISNNIVGSKGTTYITTKKNGKNVYKTRGNPSAKAMFSAYNHIIDSYSKR